MRARPMSCFVPRQVRMTRTILDWMALLCLFGHALVRASEAKFLLAWGQKATPLRIFN